MWDVFALWLFHRLGAGNVFDPNQQFVPYQYIYTQRPDGQLLRSGDTFRHSARYGEAWRKYLGFLLSASYYGDGYVYSHYLKAPADSGENRIFEFLWRDPDLKSLSINDLPLSFYMGPPFGHVIARTGWGEESAIVEMKINEYNFVNHQHSDAGNFQIYYKGALAIDSGLYQGTGGAYHSLHDMNYNKRTIAHNCLLIYDPDEKFGEIRGEEVRNDGGQWRHWGEPRTLEVLLSDGYKTGKILAHAVGPDAKTPVYTYLKGDITEAYSRKVSEVKRSFVFLNLGDTSFPAALIVFDRVVASNPDFRKYWLLHSMEEPQISGNQITITRNEHGEQGKLVDNVLLPEMDNASVTAVGGPGREFWVFGENYPNAPRWNDMRSVEAGGWRVEVSPKEPSAVDYFLNVIQVMDQKVEQPLQIERIDGKDVFGVKLLDKIVLFSRESSLMKGPVRFSIDSEGSVDILVTDLASGECQISKDGEVLISEIQCQAEEHLIYFAGNTGYYELSLRQ